VTNDGRKTLRRTFLELQDAWYDLALVVAYALKVDLVCECLTYLIQLATTTTCRPRDDE